MERKIPSISPHQALDRLMQLCSGQEKCKADLRQKLHRWNIEGEEAEAILVQLEKDNFVDEQRFASAFAKDKIRFNKWGRGKVRYQLLMKAIPEAFIVSAFDGLEEDEYNLMVRTEVLAKIKKTKAKSDWERKGKTMQFAQSRGYEPDLVMKILDDVLDE